MKTAHYIIFLFVIIPATVLSAVKKPVDSERHLKIKIVYKVSVTGTIKHMLLKMAIPHDVKNRQTINDLDFSVQPDSIYTKYNNRYALFSLYNVDKDFKIIVKEEVTIFRSIAEKNSEADTALQQYLLPEKDIESDNPQIMTTAASLKQKTDIETVMQTFDYVKEHITYKKQDAIGAKEVLESGIGKCMDFSDLFVALLRANKIPAKSMFGMVAEEDELGLHAWPEAYLKRQGWVQFDPTTGHSDIRQDGKNYVMSISNKYIITMQGRNEPELRTSEYSYWWQGETGSAIKIKANYEWREG